MKKTACVAFIALALAGCGGAPPSPPALEYRADEALDLAYGIESSTVVTVSIMGQSMEMSQEGTGTYDVGIRRGSSGLDVRLAVRELDASLNSPLGAPVRVDESYVDGALEFTIDRLGNASLVSAPSVREEASQMFSGLALTNGFFPGLPGRAVVVGDRWVDTVAYVGQDEMGERAETTVMEYMVSGDTVLAGRSLLVIDMTGTMETEFELEVAGMPVSQASRMELQGHVLWDHQRAVMVESHRSGAGEGTVAIPQMPGPVPIRIATSETSRLQDR